MADMKVLLALSLLFVVGHLSTEAASLKILAIPTAWPSHVDCFQKLCAELARRGHAVTMVLNIPRSAVSKDCAVASKRLDNSGVGVQCVHYNESRKNVPVLPSTYTIMGAAAVMEVDVHEAPAVELEKITQSDPVTILRTCVEYALGRTDSLLRDKDLMEHVANTKYDVYLSDMFDFGADILSDAINLPRVELNTGGTIPWLLYLFHNILFSPAYVPSAGLTGVRAPYMFSKRLQNFGRMGGLTAIKYFLVTPMIDDFRLTHNVPHTTSKRSGFQKQSMLIISMGEPAWNPSYPIPPNVKVVGQFVDEGGIKPMTTELEPFFSDPDQPVVVVSEGSMLSWGDAELATLLAAIERLGSLRVVCRMSSQRRQRMMDGGVDLAGYEASGRFKFLPWLPQAAALAHPNTKLFVSHCGMHGIREALEHAVVIVCVPILGDQLENAELVVAHGVGDHLRREVLKAGSVADTAWRLNRSLSCEDCKHRATLVSHRMSMHQVPPVQQAAHWVEYIAELNHGEDFLVPSGYHLPWYISVGLDLFAFTLLALVFVSMLAYKLMRYLITLSLQSKLKQD